MQDTEEGAIGLRIARGWIARGWIARGWIARGWIARGWFARTSIRATAAIVGVALIATACSSTPSVVAFNSQANGICQSFRPKLESVFSAIALAGSRSQSQLESALSSALTPAEQGSSQLEGLARPSGEGSALSKAFASQNAQVQQLKRLATALEQKKAKIIQSSETALEESEAPLNQQFDVLGLTDCGSGPASSPTGTG